MDVKIESLLLDLEHADTGNHAALIERIRDEDSRWLTQAAPDVARRLSCGAREQLLKALREEGGPRLHRKHRVRSLWDFSRNPKPPERKEEDAFHIPIAGGVSPDCRMVALSAWDQAHETSTYVINGVPWENKFKEVGPPIFNPVTSDVAAMVETEKGQTVAENGKAWEKHFSAVDDMPQYSMNGKRLIAAVQDNNGQWMIVDRGSVLPDLRSDSVPYFFFTEASSEIVAILSRESRKGGEEEKQTLWREGCGAWTQWFDQISAPVASAYGSVVAALVGDERHGQTIAVNGVPWDWYHDCGAPAMSSDGKTIVAPVRDKKGGLWRLASTQSVEPLSFLGCGNVQVGEKGILIVLPIVQKKRDRYLFRVLQNGVLWKHCSPEKIELFSLHDPSSTVAAVMGFGLGQQAMVVNDRKWKTLAPLMGRPIISPQGKVAALFQDAEGRDGLLIEDEMFFLPGSVHTPHFSPDGSEVLTVCITEKGVMRIAIRV